MCIQDNGSPTHSIVSENLERIRAGSKDNGFTEDVIQNVAGTLYAAGSDTVSCSPCGAFRNVVAETEPSIPDGICHSIVHSWSPRESRRSQESASGAGCCGEARSFTRLRRRILSAIYNRDRKGDPALERRRSYRCEPFISSALYPTAHGFTATSFSYPTSR